MSSREHQSAQPAAAALSMSASSSRKRKIDSNTQDILYGAAVTVDVADVGPDAPSGVISVDDSGNSSADKDLEELIIKKKLQYEHVKAELLVLADTHARKTIHTYAKASRKEQSILYDENAWKRVVNAYPQLPEGWDEYDDEQPDEIVEAMQYIGILPECQSDTDYNALRFHRMVRNEYLARIALAIMYSAEDVVHAKQLLNI